MGGGQLQGVLKARAAAFPLEALPALAELRPFTYFINASNRTIVCRLPTQTNLVSTSVFLL